MSATNTGIEPSNIDREIGDLMTLERLPGLIRVALQHQHRIQDVAAKAYSALGCVLPPSPAES